MAISLAPTKLSFLTSSTELHMTDDALVTFGAPVAPDALSFHDVGFMPVNSITISGLILGIPVSTGLNGMFIQYAANGVQHFSNGLPTMADYTSLQYQLIGYSGHATFGHAADGTPTVSGLLTQVVLTQGDLIAGHLAFASDGGITGEVDVSAQVAGRTVGAIDVKVQHAAGDVGQTATGGLTLSGGHLTGTFTLATG